MRPSIKACLTGCLILAVLGVGMVIVFADVPILKPVQSNDETSWLADNIPHHVSVRMNPAEIPLIAGEKAELEFEVFLKSGETEEDGRSYTWNPESPPPVIWVSAPQHCGIQFIATPKGQRPDQQARLLLQKPDTPDGVYKGLIECQVDSRAAAIHSYFWFDVSASLIAPDGTKLRDAGEVLAPITIDTHLNTKLLILAVIAIAVFLFIVEWVRVDVVAILIMVALPELGLLDPKETFKGLSSNAVIAIIGVMIISAALNRVGLVNRVIQPFQRFIGKSSMRLMVIFSSMIAVISSAMQNTGAAVLFLPAIRVTADKVVKTPISRVLMPIGMAAILGGTMTMIGTSPLILLNDLLPAGMEKFGFLELTPIGVALVVGGLIYFMTAGRYILTHHVKGHQTESGNGNDVDSHPLKEYEKLDGPFEIHVPESYRPGEGPQRIAEIRRKYLVNIVALASRRGVENTSPSPGRELIRGLSLFVYGPKKNVEEFAHEYRLDLREELINFRRHFNPAIVDTVEVVISPRSELVGKAIKAIRFRDTYRVNALALYQDGEVYYRELADRPLKAGDAILLHGTRKQFAALKEHHQNFIFTSATDVELQKPEKSKHALVCFIVTLALMLISSFYFQGRSFNPIPLSICLMAGALGMILCGVVSIGEAYRAVDWRTVFLLGGLLPLGMAVEKTGTAEWMAGGIVNALGDSMGPLLLLFVLALLSAGLTLVISNVGACALLVPLGISLATRIGIDPRVAAIVVGIGVSNSFILPTHQVNALYMGPGGYRTLDYIKVGGPLSLLYITVLVTMTYCFYL